MLVELLPSYYAHSPQFRTLRLVVINILILDSCHYFLQQGVLRHFLTPLSLLLLDCARLIRCFHGSLSRRDAAGLLEATAGVLAIGASFTLVVQEFEVDAVVAQYFRRDGPIGPLVIPIATLRSTLLIVILT